MNLELRPFDVMFFESAEGEAMKLFYCLAVVGFLLNPNFINAQEYENQCNAIVGKSVDCSCVAKIHEAEIKKGNDPYGDAADILTKIPSQCFLPKEIFLKNAKENCKAGSIWATQEIRNPNYCNCYAEKLYPEKLKSKNFRTKDAENSATSACIKG